MRLKTVVYLWLITFVTLPIPLTVAQTFSVIHTFTGGGDGSDPEAGVAIRGGVLYGTASGGGNHNFPQGAVYEIMDLGSGWVTTPIYIFNATENDGAYPRARVVFGPDGHPYGTTYTGGTDNHGTVFDLIPPLSICKTANCACKENVPYSFTGYPSDGSEPGYGDLIWDQRGNIYNTTTSGGPSDFGTVYQLKKSGNIWAEMPIHSFSGPDGEQPQGSVILDQNGNLFGTTFGGGLYGYGTLFKLTYTPESGWVETVLYSFNYDDEAYPYSGLISDSNGNLYGTSSGNGVGHGGNGGTVFELTPAGDTWILTLLYTFSGGEYCGPHAALTLDAVGDLYGTTNCDGAYSAGNVFKLTNTGNGWAYSSLHDFTGGADGEYPVSNVSIDTDGNLYGTTQHGGTGAGGVVWMIRP
jgi:uncharacterized repeat protein (TIGR03803 family)